MYEKYISRFQELMEECYDSLDWYVYPTSRKILRERLHQLRDRNNPDSEQRLKEIISHMNNMRNADRRISECIMDQRYRQFQLNKMIEDFLGYSIYLEQQHRKEENHECQK